MSELSVKKLKQAQTQVNESESFRHLGNIDTRMAVQAGKTCFLISFEGFSCHGVEKVDINDLRDANFIVKMTNDQWKRFLESGNSLVDFDTVEGVVFADNPRKKLDFLRYNTSIQAFFDAYAGRQNLAA